MLRLASGRARRQSAAVSRRISRRELLGSTLTALTPALLSKPESAQALEIEQVHAAKGIIPLLNIFGGPGIASDPKLDSERVYWHSNSGYVACASRQGCVEWPHTFDAPVLGTQLFRFAGYPRTQYLAVLAGDSRVKILASDGKATLDYFLQARPYSAPVISADGKLACLLSADNLCISPLSSRSSYTISIPTMTSRLEDLQGVEGGWLLRDKLGTLSFIGSDGSRASSSLDDSLEILGRQGKLLDGGLSYDWDGYHLIKRSLKHRVQGWRRRSEYEEQKWSLADGESFEFVAADTNLAFIRRVQDGQVFYTSGSLLKAANYRLGNYSTALVLGDSLIFHDAHHGLWLLEKNGQTRQLAWLREEPRQLFHHEKEIVGVCRSGIFIRGMGL